MLGREAVKNGNIYVKFFQKLDGPERVDPANTKIKKFAVVITDLETTGYFEIQKATQLPDGRWELTCLDKEKIILPQEPETSRKIKYVRFFLKPEMCWKDPSYGSYKEAKNTLSEKKWYIEHITEDGKTIHTSRIVKLWKNGGKCHAETVSGSHYCFVDG